MKENVEMRWMRFLSRWMFVMPVPVLLLFVSIGMLLSRAGGVPVEQAYMVAASQEPLGLRLLGLAITLLWGTVAVFFIAAAGAFKGRYPMRGTFLGATGLGFLIPMSAGNVQWTAAMDMARRYGAAATEEQRETLRQIQLTVFQIVESRIDFSNLLWVLGMALLISMAREAGMMPKTTAALYALSAFVMLGVFASHVVGYPFPFVLIPAYWAVTLGAHLTFGAALVRGLRTGKLHVDATASA
ncbi:hypothetical protein [Paenibacillus sp.]|uniref:hypothetical protein n=1 Tax=Paenibacillus sp. TaxID=58172 RepID=UPI002D687878|nr:hypothetical protein [Paenibacillus sp.]HZG85598.1 hypothetical protein [Paenibacillus sp.]